MQVAFLIASLLGCNEFGFDPIDREAPPADRLVEEVFVQAPLPAVDLLFVLDATPSMTQEYELLRSSVDELMGQLDAAELRWQIGAVGANMGAADAGLLRGRPWVVTPDTPEREQAVASLMGASPVPGDEAGLAAAHEALRQSEPGGGNEGFRRPGALLHVVFVSDADDASDPWLADPVVAVIEALNDTPSGAVASALVGDVPGGCTSPRGTAQAGHRYVEVAEATGGVVASICEADFAHMMGDIGAGSVVLPAEFLLREAPRQEAVTVLVDDEPVTAFELRSDPPAIRFDQAPAASSRIVVTYSVSNQ